MLGLHAQGKESALWPGNSPVRLVSESTLGSACQGPYRFCMDAALIWLLVGFALIVAEFFLTSFFVIFFGIAAVVVALALWAGLPAASGMPYLLFAAVAVGTLLALRSRFRGWFAGTYADEGVDEDFMGREVLIESGFDASSPGRGRVSYRGAAWDARSDTETISAGARASITGRSGTQLHVTPL